jgi:amidase
VDDYPDYDVTGLAELVRERAVAPVELAEEAIRRMEAGEPALNALVHRSFDEGLAAARVGLPAGRLRGVPFLIKDLGGLMAGQPAFAGSGVLRALGLRAPHTGLPVKRLLDAGVVVLGRTNTAELGLSYTTEPAAFGATHNPWDLELSAGGSSGGSAAAVAAGYLPAAHAGDGGGSARLPASVTGIVGLKPTRGRISVGPDADEQFSGYGTEAFVCRTVRDAALLLDVMSGYMPGDPYVVQAPRRRYTEEVGASAGSLRIGVLSALPGIATDPECSAAAERAGRLLADLGHVVEAQWPAALDRYVEQLTPVFRAIVAVAAAAQVHALGAMLGQPLDVEGFEPLTRVHIRTGQGISASEHLLNRTLMQRFARELASWWDVEGWDVLVTPTVPTPPFPLGHLGFDARDPEASHRRIADMGAYCQPFSAGGEPAISLPLARSPEGLPIGVQLIAAAGRDDLLLRLAAELERAAPWHDRGPAELSRP